MKTWCEHLKWTEFYGGSFAWSLNGWRMGSLQEDANDKDNDWFNSDYQFCPICGAKKPEELRGDKYCPSMTLRQMRCNCHDLPVKNEANPPDEPRKLWEKLKDTYPYDRLRDHGWPEIAQTAKDEFLKVVEELSVTFEQYKAPPSKRYVCLNEVKERINEMC